MAGIYHDDVIPVALAEAEKREVRADQARAASFVSEKKDGTALAHVSSPQNDHTDPSDPHYGDEFPTEEEIAHLHRVPDKIPWATYLVAYIELAERFSYYGSFFHSPVHRTVL
jgi:POT family proton-dependent oligopeptide transporter